MLATDVEMVRKELKSGSLSVGTVCYQTVVFCFENNKNYSDYVMLFINEVLRS